MVLATSIFTVPFFAIVIIGGLLLTWIVSALVSRVTKSKSKTSTQPFSQPSSPSLPSQGQLPPSSKDHTALLVAIIGAVATIIAAVITALLK